MYNNTGFIVIGRNEGDRLVRCLKSILKYSEKAVYVDSGSTDNSTENSRELGIGVVELDMRIPFSAARARNAGFKYLTETYSDIKFVQFIDGDCELKEGWIEKGVRFLVENKMYAVAAGRRREKFPNVTVYNLLSDIEWNTPIGDAEAIGGDFLIRVTAFRDAGGFNPTVIAGEEPDLCYRLRKSGWKIRRLDQEMTNHDAAMHSFNQWWRRAKRAGHAYIHGYMLHRKDGEGYYFKKTLQPWFWVVALPIGILILSVVIAPIFLTALALYPIQAVKIAVRERRRVGRASVSLLYGFFTMIAKWPQLTGQFLFIKRYITGKNMTIIEHKH
jgi:GT2 family glycosyltransferase